MLITVSVLCLSIATHREKHLTQVTLSGNFTGSSGSAGRTGPACECLPPLSSLEGKDSIIYRVLDAGRSSSIST